MDSCVLSLEYKISRFGKSVLTPYTMDSEQSFREEPQINARSLNFWAWSWVKQNERSDLLFHIKKNTFALGKDFLFVLHFSGPGPPGSIRKFFLNYIYFNVFFFNFGYIFIWAQWTIWKCFGKLAKMVRKILEIHLCSGFSKKSVFN